MTINGAACGLKSVARNEIVFVVPPALGSVAAGTSYKAVVNNNGSVFSKDVTIVPARPDIFRKDGVVAPFGRARLLNVTNTVHTMEPFAVRTIRRRGNRLVPSVIRMYLTGVADAQTVNVSVRIRDVIISGGSVTTAPSLVEPGVYTFDFLLPATLQGAGDQPIVVIVTLSNGDTFTSRLDDTSARVFIL